MCCLGRWVAAKRSLRGQISDLSAGARFVSLLWTKTAAPLKAVSIRRGGGGRRGVPPVPGWEPGLGPSLVHAHPAPTGRRDPLLGARGRPFPGTPLPSFGRRLSQTSQAEVSLIGITMKLLSRNIAILENVLEPVAHCICLSPRVTAVLTKIY